MAHNSRVSGSQSFSTPLIVEFESGGLVERRPRRDARSRWFHPDEVELGDVREVLVIDAPVDGAHVQGWTVAPLQCAIFDVPLGEQFLEDGVALDVESQTLRRHPLGLSLPLSDSERTSADGADDFALFGLHVELELEKGVAAKHAPAVDAVYGVRPLFHHVDSAPWALAVLNFRGRIFPFL